MFGRGSGGGTDGAVQRPAAATCARRGWPTRMRPRRCVPCCARCATTRAATDGSVKVGRMQIPWTPRCGANQARPFLHAVMRGGARREVAAGVSTFKSGQCNACSLMGPSFRLPHASGPCSRVIAGWFGTQPTSLPSRRTFAMCNARTLVLMQALMTAAAAAGAGPRSAAAAPRPDAGGGAGGGGEVWVQGPAGDHRARLMPAAQHAC